MRAGTRWDALVRAVVAPTVSNLCPDARADSELRISANSVPDELPGVPHSGTYGMVQYDRLSVEFRSGDAEGGMDFESGADRQTLGL